MAYFAKFTERGQRALLAFVWQRLASGEALPAETMKRLAENAGCVVGAMALCES